MAGQAVAARGPWRRLVPGAFLPLSPFQRDGRAGARGRRLAGLPSFSTATNPVAFSLAAPLWEQPRRLQHEGRPSPSDQVRLPPGRSPR